LAKKAISEKISELHDIHSSSSFHLPVPFSTTYLPSSYRRRRGKREIS
jgi:hypothetical protein